MVTEGPNGGLRPVEKSLVEHVVRGELLDLAGDEAVDDAAMRSWRESRTVVAVVIRDILRGRLAADPDPHGLRLRGARIIGRLDLENLTTDVNLELMDCLLEEGVLARGAHLTYLGLARCQIEHTTEPAFDAERLTCGVLALSGARTVSHAKRGAVCLNGAHIGSQLDCAGAELINDSGPALFANGLQVDQGMYLTRGFAATGSGALGAVRLVGALIGGQLSCDGAKLRNDSGPALVAAGLQVSGALMLRDGFTATGHATDGAVDLLGAHIGGNLECVGAELTNDSGPALVADSLQVNLAMLLRDGFAAVGHSIHGTVRLLSAQVGSLDCDGAELRNDSGPALVANSLQADQDVFLNRFTAIGGGSAPTVDLSGARVGRVFWFDPARVGHAADPHRRLVVNGLTYPGVPEPVSAQDWLRLLRDGTPAYAAQPYQQLAAGCRALGDERQVREVLMAQRDDQLARARPRPHWTERGWGRITRITLGYGYQPWRALLFLAGVVALSCVLAVMLGAHGALAQTSQTATPGKSCTLVQQISVGLDLNLPVGTTVARVDCNLTTDSASSTAVWLTVIGWVLRVLAWAFAALFIAGFTGAVRKT